jgi:pyrimidine operon attenuation protein/uracil phosphoribosyltransferase
LIQADLPFTYSYALYLRPMKPLTLLNGKQLDLTLNRLAIQLIEVHGGFEDSAIIGIQRTGALFSKALIEKIKILRPGIDPLHGLLDVTFFRDDFGRRGKPLQAFSTELDFAVEGKNIVLVDDVLFTGRTIRAAMDALMSLGRPAHVELMVLIDRRFSRQLPIEPTYTGKRVDSIASQHVDVKWYEKGFKEAILYDKNLDT